MRGSNVVKLSNPEKWLVSALTHILSSFGYKLDGISGKAVWPFTKVFSLEQLWGSLALVLRAGTNVGEVTSDQ